jgi:hypothetical protein
MHRRTRPRTQTARRATLALLAALAVTLGAVAAPLAGTAHAGSKPSIAVGANAVAVDLAAARSPSAIRSGHAAAPARDPGAGAGTIDTRMSAPPEFGTPLLSKPGGGAGPIDIAGSKPGVSGGTSW